MVGIRRGENIMLILVPPNVSNTALSVLIDSNDSITIGGVASIGIACFPRLSQALSSSREP